jgi:O-antigen/teichoic acid export membrane protein
VSGLPKTDDQTRRYAHASSSTWGATLKYSEHCTMLAMDPEHAGPRVAQEGAGSAQRPSVKRRLLTGSAWATGGRIVISFTAFATNALLARLLSHQDLGLYFLAFSIVGVGALLGSLGMDQAVVRFVAQTIGLGRFQEARRTLGRTLALGSFGALSAGVAYLFLGRLVGEKLFHAPALVAATGLVAVWISVMTLQALLGGAFRSFHDIRLSTVFNGLVTGVLIATSLGVLWLLRDKAGLTTALLLTVGSGLLNVVLGGWVLRRKVSDLPATGDEEAVLDAGTIMRVALPLAVTNLTIFVMTQGDLWILGAFRPPDEVAIYGAAARAVVLIAMPLLILNGVLPPLIAEMYAQGNTRQLERTLRATAAVAGIPAFLVLTAFILFGGPILGLVFGDYFTGGATVLALLSIAQLVNVWTGAGSITLAYTGHHATIMTLTVVAGVTVIIAGLAMVGPYGTTGVAAAMAAGITTYNVALWLATRLKTGMWTHVGFSGFSDALRVMRRSGGRT